MNRQTPMSYLKKKTVKSFGSNISHLHLQRLSVRDIEVIIENIPCGYNPALSDLTWWWLGDSLINAQSLGHGWSYCDIVGNLVKQNAHELLLKTDIHIPPRFK